MTKEDIQLALRLVAMGRVNHPQVEALAEKLELAFKESQRFAAPSMTDEEIMNERPTPEEVSKAVEHLSSLAKRRKKAD